MKRMNKLVSVLLPIYNEKDNVFPLLEEITSVLRKDKQPFEIIAVDDGSNDGTQAELRKAAQEFPELKVIFFRRNSGQTAALDAGFRHAAGEIVATMDADRQNDPHDLPRMLKKLEEGYDCVAGWRKDRQDGFLLRRLPSSLANLLIRRLWNSQLKDLGCSLKVYRREITQELRLYGEMHRFINILIEGMGARVASVEVNHRPRVAGKSKYNLTRVFKVLLDIVMIWFLQNFRTKPLHVFGGVGGLCFLGSSLSGLTSIVQKFAFDVSLNRNPLFTLSIFMAVLAVQFVVLGLLAELMIRNYYETTNSPPYSIKDRLGFDPPRKRKAA